ncbi:uncharacterized protein LOC133347607 [Lethenteron reissneri]|uniref:uncharacterized protein LOC133347607 n=1 Tax=Lethenteron reissneri TaxID=7753 RepID=UPI002AB786A2|nr:uncharacterized protein LOC133347607 [Lethenteron reissneri]
MAPPAEGPGPPLSGWALLLPASLLALLAASLALCATCRRIFPKAYNTFQGDRLEEGGGNPEGIFSHQTTDDASSRRDSASSATIHIPRARVAPQMPLPDNGDNNKDKGGCDSDAVMMDNSLYQSVDEFSAPGVPSTAATAPTELYATVLKRQGPAPAGSAVGSGVKSGEGSVKVNPVQDRASRKTPVPKVAADTGDLYATVDKSRSPAPRRGRPSEVAPTARPDLDDSIYEAILE